MLDNVLVDKEVQRIFSLRLFRYILQRQITQMQAQSKTKLQSIIKEERQKTRRALLAQLRQQLRQARTQPQDTDLSQRIMRLINQGQNDQIYRLLLIDKHSKKYPLIASLDSPTSVTLFQFLNNNLCHHHNLLTLGNLIQFKHSAIFNNPLHKQMCDNFVQAICRLISQVVAQARLQLSQGNQIKENVLMGLLLSCLKAVIFGKDESNNQQSSYQSVSYLQIIAKNVVKWFDVLYSNPVYLYVMAVMCQDQSIPGQLPLKQQLLNCPQAMLTVVQQINPMHSLKRMNALPSLTIANFVMRDQKHPELGIYCLPTYLQQVKIVFKFSQSQANQFYKKHTFKQTLSALTCFLQQIAQEQLQQHLGSSMVKGKFWSFAMLMLKTQNYAVREKVHSIIHYTAKNMLVNGASFEDYIGQELIRHMVEALEQHPLPKCKLEVVKTLFCILKYCEQHRDRQTRFVQWINQCGIDIVLQELVYFQGELGVGANNLCQLKKRLSYQEDKIEQEDLL